MSTVEPPHRRRRAFVRKAKLPQLSGKVSAIWLVCCFLISGLLIPTVLRFPLWVDFEIALATWWLIWTVVLTRLLYRGQRLSDDYELSVGGSGERPIDPSDSFWSPRHEKKNAGGNHDDKSSSDSSSAAGSYLGFGPEPEGILGLVLAVVALLLVGAAIWLLVEIAIPVVLFFLYFITRGMLARVVNDKHSCQGKLARATAWAALWATIYVAPLAGVTWIAHYVLGRSA